GLPVGLAINRLLRAPAEDDEGDQRAEHHPERDHHVPGEAARDDSDSHRDGHDQDERADHVRQQPLVLFALHLERLPQLAAALLGGRLAGGFGLGLGCFRGRGIAGFSHLFRILILTSPSLRLPKDGTPRLGYTACLPDRTNEPAVRPAPRRIRGTAQTARARRTPPDVPTAPPGGDAPRGAGTG